MHNKYIEHFINIISSQFGKLEKIGNSLSLFKIVSIDTLIYFRYSKISQISNYTKAFYGLRKKDIKELENYKNSFICFTWDEIDKCILLPFNNYKIFFDEFSPSSDGQYKVLIFFKNSGTELYLAKVGKFNVDSCYGINELNNISMTNIKIPNLSHSQIQTLVGSIGFKKGFNIWIPETDRTNLDFSIGDNFEIISILPNISKIVDRILPEIDVIWLDKTNNITKLFEVEHSTPIYSGLIIDRMKNNGNIPANYQLKRNLKNKENSFLCELFK